MYYARVIVRRLSAVDKICDRYVSMGWNDEGPETNDNGEMVLVFSSDKPLPEPNISDLNQR